MKRRHYITPDEAEKIVQLYIEQDLRTVQIAEIIGVAHPTISDWIHKAGIDVRAIGRQKQSRTLSKKPPHDEFIKGARLAHKGRTKSEECKAKISKTLTGRTLSFERKEKVRKIKQNDIQTIINMHVNQLMTCTEIGKIMGVGHHTIAKRLRENGINPDLLANQRRKDGTTKVTDQITDNMEDMFLNQEMNPNKIAEQLGLAHPTVIDALKNRGVYDRRISDKRRADRKKYTKLDYEEKHPFFSKIETIRDNLDGPGIQVTCKLCGDWFTPTESQLRTRLKAIELPNGNDANYLYCSDECKRKCSIFNSKATGHLINLYYSVTDLNIWSQFVVARDKECLYCGSTEDLQAHHINPKSTHPREALDPDNGITVCKGCHGRIHRGECSAPALAVNAC
jgi:5-methylcytosine-specific restriction endonuclease McrA/transposase-like protein